MRRSSAASAGLWSWAGGLTDRSRGLFSRTGFCGGCTSRGSNSGLTAVNRGGKYMAEREGRTQPRMSSSVTFGLEGKRKEDG